MVSVFGAVAAIHQHRTAFVIKSAQAQGSHVCSSARLISNLSRHKLMAHWAVACNGILNEKALLRLTFLIHLLAFSPDASSGGCCTIIVLLAEG
jgi:hypothetical protein